MSRNMKQTFFFHTLSKRGCSEKENTYEEIYIRMNDVNFNRMVGLPLSKQRNKKYELELTKTGRHPRTPG